ncbi:response regulator [Sphingomonas trueperi]|uniref:response regulator n=1 Tax=Sphingomonas trueperi TaxID=53317 RepID=UPI00339164A8
MLLDKPVLILLVEDEPIMLIHAQDALEDGGYTVVEASSGEDAIQLLSQQGDQIIGLVTDVRLGKGMNGWDVARRAREQKASLPVVYLTAESAEDWAAQGVPKSLLVQKPYAPAQLLTAISTLINEASANAAG